MRGRLVCMIGCSVVLGVGCDDGGVGGAGRPEPPLDSPVTEGDETVFGSIAAAISVSDV